MSSKSIVTLQVGQCGNQLGKSLYDLLSTEAYRQTDECSRRNYFERFFRLENVDSAPLPIARSVLVDMEPKVVEMCMKSNGNWGYDKRNAIVSQSGSANNWSFGYVDHGPRVRDDVMELVRKEMECADNVSMFLILNSVAGGTGSGLGAFLTEAIRDELSSRTLITNCIVWPFGSGEVILQNYNALLTLASVSQNSDGIILFENELISNVCKLRLEVMSPSFTDINSVLSENLSNLLLPSSSNIEDIIAHLFSHPGYRISSSKMIPQVSVKSKAFTSNRWSYLMKHMYQMQIADACMEDGIDWSINTKTSFNKSLSSFLCLRGIETKTIDLDIFKHSELYAPWIVNPLQIGYSDKFFNQNDKTAALWSVSQSVLKPIKSAYNKACDMMENKAFLHHYSRFGIGEEEMSESIMDVAQIITNYESLSL